MSKKLLLIIAATAALLVLAGTALAAGFAVTLNLQGGYANRVQSACGAANHYVYYRPRRRINFKGSVSPAPSGTRQVKVKIKRCVHGRFVRLKELHLRVNSRGAYQGSFTIRGRGFYFARTYFYGSRPASKSQKQHFRIR